MNLIRFSLAVFALTLGAFLSAPPAHAADDLSGAQWAIWWVDSRAPHGALDPPVKGRFEKGVGKTWDTNWVMEFRRL